MSRRDLCWLALVLGTGCDRVFGLDRTTDAAIPIDASYDASLAMCPPSYAPVQNGETRYRFVVTSASWAQAQADCVDDTAPSITHLVEFTPGNELKVLQGVIPFGPAWQAWTGYAHDSGADPFVFFASTGPVLPLGSPIWAANEPDGGIGQGEETGTLFSDAYAVIDVPPSGPLPYVCECDGRLVTRTFQLVP